MRADSVASASVRTVAAHATDTRRSRRSTTARPQRATPGSIPGTRVSNIRSPESRRAPGVGQRPDGHAGAPSAGGVPGAYREAITSSGMSKFA